MDKNIEIPFGAYDSELCGWEYTIPEGFVAEIKDGKVIVKKAESEDERIRKAIMAHIYSDVNDLISGVEKRLCISWLEKQKIPKCSTTPDLTTMLVPNRYNEQKPAEWSEEDEHYFQNLIMAVDSTFSEGDTKNWLKNRFKSLRPQPHWKQSLATADLENNLCDIQDNYHDSSHEYKVLGEAIEFIRSTESPWKPSEEQMEWLGSAVRLSHDKPHIHGIILSLYEQLKQL